MHCDKMSWFIGLNFIFRGSQVHILAHRLTVLPEVFVFSVFPGTYQDDLVSFRLMLRLKIKGCNVEYSSLSLSLFILFYK